MIEKNIGDHARVMAMIRNQHATKRGHVRMRVGECVESAMLADSFANAGRELVTQGAFDEIAGEVADQQFRRIAGEKEMR